MTRFWTGVRPRRSATGTAVVLAVALLSAGCSGRDYHARGMQYMASDEPDAAVDEFRKAVRAEPDNSEYKTSLADAETQAAEGHYERAERLVAEHRLAEARSELQRALDLRPEHANAAAMLRHVDSQLAGTPDTAAQPSEPPRPPDTEQTPAPPQTQPVGAAVETPKFPPGSYPGTLSRHNSEFPKEVETLDGIIMRLKNASKKPLQADIEVRVGKLAKRYRELGEGSRITGRGLSRRPYQLTILSIEPESKTVSFVIEPLTQLPPR